MSGLQELSAGDCGTIAGRSGDLSALVYRSRAARPLSPPDLLQLTLAAQARNRREAVTGVMVYDQSRFYQWLEGPDDGVDRIMGSILRDRRHTDIEILDKKPVQARAFADWSMKLAMPGASDGRPEIIEPPRDVVENLHRSPDAAPTFLVKLFSLGPAMPVDALESLSIRGKAADILRGVMLSTVIPRLVRQHSGGRAAVQGARPSFMHARAKELADLLIAPDRTAAMSLIREIKAAQALTPLYATLFEPAARRLGALWQPDDCSEFDVTLGLCRLQSAVDLLGSSPVQPGLRGRYPTVLIAPEPGELHRLGAALDCDVLRRAGWLPRCEYPVDDEALQDLVGASWFDVLDLSLSAAFSREDRLPMLAETITLVRRASLNPDLVIMVAGRAFVEHHAVALSVGADLATTSSLEVDRSILRMMGPKDLKAGLH